MSDGRHLVEGRCSSVGASEASSSRHGPKSKDDNLNTLVSVRDARQQRLEERSGRRGPPKGVQQPSMRGSPAGTSSQSSANAPALSTSLASAFKRPPERLPPNRMALGAAAPPVAGALSYRRPESGRPYSGRLVTVPAHQSQRPSAGGFEGDTSFTWQRPDEGPASLPVFGHLYSSPHHAQERQPPPPPQQPQQQQQQQRLDAQQRPRSSLSRQNSAGSRNAQHGSSGAGNLPSHLSQLLCDPSPLLAPPEEGDAAMSMLLHEAREQGVCHLTMRGLVQLPQALQRFLRVEGLNLKELSLQGNRLVTTPVLEQVTNLALLDLSSNELASLPDALDVLRSLQSLVLAENRLAAIPASVSRLTCLTLLDVSSNQLEELPHGLVGLHRLQHVKVDRNQLHSLPAGLLRLPSLRTLSASHNQLVAVAADLSCLKQLERLSLHHNQMTALPDTLGELRRCLTELLLNDNGLTVLPRQLCQLSRLQQLSTACNPLIFPPQHVCQKGLAAVRAFLMLHLDSWSTDEAEEDKMPESATSAEEGCSRCKDLEDQIDRTSSHMLRIQMERERHEREASALKVQAQQKELLCSQLDQQVRELLAEKLVSERSLHSRSAQHLASAEELERQALTMRATLREAEGKALAAVARLREAEEQLEVERKRAAAAITAAGSLKREGIQLDVLELKLLNSKQEVTRLGDLVAHHQFLQRASEDRQLEAEAQVEQLQALLRALALEQEATKGLLVSERSQAALQAAEAQQRERILELENESLRIQIATLMSERAMQGQAQGTSVLPNDEEDHRIVAPDADTAASLRRAGVKQGSSTIPWRLPQPV